VPPTSDVPPTYRVRLRLEGRALALTGTVGFVVLLVFVGEAHRSPLSTVIQLGILAMLVAWLGPASARRAMVGAEQRPMKDLGSGEPTPLWQLPAIVVALTALAGLLAGWDAGLRVSAGCVLVGLGQAILLERVVGAEEATSRRRFFRVAGSRILRGTRLGYIKL